MRKAIVAVVVLSFAVVCIAETAEEFDRRAEQELRAISPHAVDYWQRANRARSEKRFEEAIDLYEEVLAYAPRFHHAMRRMGKANLALGKRDRAIEQLRYALTVSRSPETLTALAGALVTGSVPAEHHEAVQLATEAEALNPNDADLNQVLAQAALATDDLPLLRRAAERLERLAPHDWQTHYLKHIVQASDGDYTDARASLTRARELGMAAEIHQASLVSLEDATPFYIRWGKAALIVIAAWFGGFALLLLAGVILSRVAMTAAQQPPAQLAENATGLSGRVRKIYAAVLTLSSVFYYASIPIVLLIVLGTGGAVIYGFFALGRIPVKLLIFVVVLVAISAWSILKSLFIRPSDEDPGTKLDLDAQPRLRRVLDEVAAQIGTRAVDNVYLTPGTDVAVMERKRGRERCLILGIAALDGFRMLPFRAVLGHEYGHFSNRDTAGGAFALSVRRSLGAMAIALAQGGAAVWYNPAWLFVNAFHRVFLRISEGASRLQEILADRWAVFAYGAAAFEEGLRHVIERSVRFDAHVGATLQEVVDRKLPLANLYTYTPAEAKDVAEAVEAAIHAEGSAYDSHPPAAQRFALVHALPKHERVAAVDDELPAWSLFENPEELQHRMTDQVRANVAANYGVAIPA